MSDDTKQTDTDLFDSDSSEGGAETSNTTEGQDFDPDVSQGNGKSKAEVEAQKQEDAWFPKYLRGEELPKNLNWLLPRLQSRAGTLQKEPEIDQIVERKLAEKAQQEKFLSLKMQVNQSGLNQEQKQLLESEFKDLMQAGVSKDKALEKAIKITGVSIVDPRIYAQRREDMALPQQAPYRNTQNAQGLDPESTDQEGFANQYMNLPEKERMAFASKMMR